MAGSADFLGSSQQIPSSCRRFMMNVKVLLVTIASLSLVGCETGGPKQTGGTLIGGAAGALLGSQFGKGDGQLVGVALGTLLGSQVGATIGKQMDDQDRSMASKAAYNALERQPDNRSVGWKNPNTNHSGNIVVTNTTENRSANKVCRDFVQTVNIDGEQQKVYGRACRDVRDSQGQWIVQPN